MRNLTLDPSLRSWVDVPEGSNFPDQTLPFGVFWTKGMVPRIGVEIGDHVIDMATLSASASENDGEPFWLPSNGLRGLRVRFRGGHSSPLCQPP